MICSCLGRWRFQTGARAGMPELVWPLREPGDQRAQCESGRRGGGDAAALGPGAGRAGETRETCRGRAGHPTAGMGNPPQGLLLPAQFLTLGLILQTAALHPQAEPEPRGPGWVLWSCHPALSGIYRDGNMSPGTQRGAPGSQRKSWRPSGFCCSPGHVWALFLWYFSEKWGRLVSLLPCFGGGQ